MKIFRFLLIITLVSTLSCSMLTSQQYKESEAKNIENLTKKIDGWFNDSRFENAFWGVKIESLDTGKVWYERNAKKAMTPASNQKMLTSAAALEELGPDFKFETYVCTNGNVVGDELKGDLIIFGNGDPSISDRVTTDSRDVFYGWADKLTSMGVKKISGNIIGDDNSFDEERLGFQWSFNYLDTWYAAEINPLVYNENVVDIKIIPPKTIDGSAEIKPNIQSGYFKLINNVKVIPEGKSKIGFDRPYGTNEITIRGEIVVGGKNSSISPSIFNPTLFYTTALKEVFESRGIKVAGNPVDCDDIKEWAHKPEDFKILIKHDSPTLSLLIRQLMKRSQNLYAENFARVLGWKSKGRGSLENGREVVQRKLEEFGINKDEYSYRDGSGLSRSNFITPDLAIRLLKAMRKSKNWQCWYDCMPIAGVDGTLKYRMRGTPAENNVHAKTGTISNVRGLSGYVKTADGENVVFSFIVNNHFGSDEDTNDITDNVLALIAGFKK